MEKINTFYCKYCQNNTRHIRIDAEEDMSQPCVNYPKVARWMGKFADVTGLNKGLEFVLDSYAFKCTKCGDIHYRKANGEYTDRP